MSVHEVIFSAANSCISYQLRYVNVVRRIPWYVIVQVRKVHNLEVVGVSEGVVVVFFSTNSDG